jgi:hypothetical protein
MTEAEWLAFRSDPGGLLIFDAHRNADRKLRLFACACVCHIRDRIQDERCRHAIEVGERLADGEAHEQERIATLQGVNAAWADAAPATLSAEEHAIVAARYTLANSAFVGFAAANRAASSLGEGKSAEQAWQSALFRDIFGNPFRPVALDPSWRTEAVVALAEGIYAERAFERMPVLADALEDAGCSHDDIVSHCRGDGPHVKGCWVVDLLTGRT